MLHYTGLLARSLRHAFGKTFGGTGAVLDQPQSNALYGVHQMRARLNNDPNTYRIIIAPVDAPISIGGVAVDQHFLEPITEAVKAGSEAA